MKFLPFAFIKSFIVTGLTLLLLSGCNTFIGTLEVEVEPVISSAPALVSPSPEPSPNATETTEVASQGPFPEALGLVYSDGVAGETWWIDMNGAPQRLYSVPNGILSPDATRLIFEREDDLWIANLDDQTEMNLTSTPDRLERSGQWWPANPDLIVFNSVDADPGWEMSAGRVSIIALDGSGYQVIEEHSSFWEPALSPDGKTLAYDTGDAAWLYHLENGKQLLDPAEFGLETPSDFKIGSPSWSPDGSSLAWWIGGSFAPQGEWKLALAVFDLRLQTVQLIHAYQPTGGSGGWLPPARWSPDGEWLILSPRGERRTSDLLAVHVKSGEAISLGPGANPLWSPDGRRLVFLRYDPQGGSFLESQVVLLEKDLWQPLILDLPRGSQPIQWFSQ